MRLFISIIIFNLILITDISAQIVPPSLQDELRRQQEQIQRDQQRLLEEELRKRELEDAIRPPIDLRPETSVSEPDVSGNCVEIMQIEYSGNVQINNRKIDKILDNYNGRCITLDEINAMLQLITNLYINDGYVTSRAYMTMPQERLNEGVLEVIILEGKVSELFGLRETEKLTAFPGIKGHILYLRDIEQGLEQLNRLPSNRATMEIEPDEKEGYSNILILNNPVNRTRIGLSIDNAGSTSTGEWRAGLRLAHDNLLNLNDQLSISYYKSIYHDNDKKRSDSLLASFNMPLGYWTISNNLSYAPTRTSVSLPISGTNMYNIGETVTNTFGISRMVWRGQKHKISAGASLTYRKTNNYTEVYDISLKNDSSSRILTILNIDAPITLYFNSGMVYMKPSYHRGLRWLNALDDRKTNYTQEAQYNAFKFYAYYARSLWKGSLNLTLDTQYSSDELFSSESFYIGGEQSVRGFKHDGAQGDSGIVIRADYSINLGQFSGKSFLRPYNLGAFIDYGYVSSNNENFDSYHLSGMGGKFSASFKYFETSIAYAAVIHKPDSIKENAAVYFSAEFKYAF